MSEDMAGADRTGQRINVTEPTTSVCVRVRMGVTPQQLKDVAAVVGNVASDVRRHLLDPRPPRDDCAALEAACHGCDINSANRDSRLAASGHIGPRRLQFDRIVGARRMMPGGVFSHSMRLPAVMFQSRPTYLPPAARRNIHSAGGRRRAPLTRPAYMKAWYKVSLRFVFGSTMP